MSENHCKHPLSLRTFFATEMWERYGFYVVQTLLALYLVIQFNWQDTQIYALVGSFTALTYLSPLIGGHIADQLIGQKRAILSGSVILMLSYCLLSIITTNVGLNISLGGIAIGTGLLKSNISSLLGNEYPPGSSKREGGFTIFYMGISTGIILATVIPSFLREHFGWHIAFLSAALGLCIAIIVFKRGIKLYEVRDYTPYQHELKRIVKATILIFSFWAIFYLILNNPSLADSVFISVVVISIAYLLYCIKHEEPIQARQTMVIGLLCIISTIFWAFYFQMFMSLTLFIARVVDSNLWGLSFPPPYYVGVQSIGMILLGIFLSKNKNNLDAIKHAIRTGNKFLLALFIMLAAYALICLVSHHSVSLVHLTPLYIIPTYVLISLAELLLSPVGLSTITVLASRKKVSTMMGVFFVSLGIGGYLSGKLANLTAITSETASNADLKMHYAQSFVYLFYILLISACLCVLINIGIQSLMKRNYKETVQS